MNNLTVILLDNSGSMRGNLTAIPSGEYVTWPEDKPAGTYDVRMNPRYLKRGVHPDGSVKKGELNRDDEGNPIPIFLGDIQLATIKGLNEFVRLQQLGIDDATLYFALFGNDCKTVYDFVSIFDMPVLDHKTIDATSGGTWLWGSIVSTIMNIDNHLNSLPEDERPVSVTMVIQTDGGDPSNQTIPEGVQAAQYGLDNYAHQRPDVEANFREQLAKFETLAQYAKRLGLTGGLRDIARTLVRRKMQEGWEFIYMAASERGGRYYTEARDGATTLGIPQDQVIEYSATDDTAFAKASEAILEAGITGKLGKLN